MNTAIDSTKDIVVIYHKNCYDGFAAAWVAHKKFGDTASYYAASDWHVPPDGLEGKEVYVLDFYYFEDALKTLVSVCKKIVVLDHHSTSKSMIGLVPEHVWEIEHSGAVLAWKYFFPKADVPRFIKYIEDADLRNFALSNTKEITAYIRSHEYDFDAFEKISNDLESEMGFEKAKAVGEYLEHSQKTRTEELLLNVEEGSLNGHALYVLNVAPDLRTRIGMLLSKWDGKGISAVYYRIKGRWKVSLRSEDGGVDVAGIAEQYGGGGHQSSAAFFLDGNTNIIDFFHIQKNPDSVSDI